MVGERGGEDEVGEGRREREESGGEGAEKEEEERREGVQVYARKKCNDRNGGQGEEQTKAQASKMFCKLDVIEGRRPLKRAAEGADWHGWDKARWCGHGHRVSVRK